MHPPPGHGLTADEDGEVLNGPGALKERNEHADEELKQHDPGKAFVTEGADQQLGKPGQPQARHEHPSEARHGEGEKRVARKERQHNGRRGRDKGEGAKAFDGLHGNS